MDFRQVITDKIVALLERGGNQYREMWARSATGGLPCNAITGNPYRGINTLMLSDAAETNGYQSNKWLTFKQAASLEGKVKKGEKGTLCVFFSMLEKSENKQDADVETDAESSVTKIPILKPFWLFNVAQVEGLPVSMTEVLKTDAVEIDQIEAADLFIARTGAIISNGGNKAFYRPSTDEIRMPDRKLFSSTDNYYAVLLHELSHWTGAKHRLSRDFTSRFGSEAYAMEELVAEMSSAFLAGKFGFVSTTLENHASYLESWLKVLKSDKQAIFAASTRAFAAYDYLHTLQEECLQKKAA